MQSTVLVFMLFCLLSTQVLGKLGHESTHTITHASHHIGEHDDSIEHAHSANHEPHNHQLHNTHPLMHELGLPHTHDSDEHSVVELSFSDDAIKHINDDGECCLVGLLTMRSTDLPVTTVNEALKFFAKGWSPPFLAHLKPPPIH